MVATMVSMIGIDVREPNIKKNAATERLSKTRVFERGSPLRPRSHTQPNRRYN
jgi:hypothetical protein